MYGKQIRIEREIRNLSQQELAKAINVSQQCISTIENDRNIPKLNAIVKIADYYQITVDELIGREIKKY